MFGLLPSPCGCFTRDDRSDYRSLFCGLSNRLSADYGQPFRFLVNRDATFLSLLTAAQAEGRPVPVMATCCNPWGAKTARFQGGAHAHYAAAVTVCGLGAKLDDEIEDGGVFGKSLGALGKAATDRAVGRADAMLRQLGLPTRELWGRLGEQRALEIEAMKSGRSAEICAVASPTSEAYGAIVGHGANLVQMDANAGAASDLGRALGGLIYWADAWEDREKDLRSGDFNPLLRVPEDERREFAAGEAGKWLGVVDRAASGLKLRRWEELVGEILTVRLPKVKSLRFASLADGDRPQPGAPIEVDPAPDVPPPLVKGQGGDQKKGKRKKKSDGDGCGCDGCCDCCHCSSGGGCDSGSTSCSGCDGSCCDSGCCDCCSVCGDGGGCCPCDCCSC